MQARFLSALDEAACLLDLSTLEMTELIVDTIWALAIAGHLHPHTCRAIINRAVAAGMKPMGPHMNHANCFKLVQARPRFDSQECGSLHHAACCVPLTDSCWRMLAHPHTHGTWELRCAFAVNAPCQLGV